VRARLAAVGIVWLLGLALTAVGLLVFTVLARAISQATPVGLDLAALAALRAHASTPLDWVAIVFSWLGSELLILFAVILGVYFLQHRLWSRALEVLVVPGGAQLLNNVLKLLFHRDRPTAVSGGLISAQIYSFPSGHAMVSAAFYLFVAYLAWHHLRGRWRTLAATGLLLLVVLIGLSRMYLAVHYLTDVVAGYCAGFVWFLSTIAGGRLLARYNGRARRAENVWIEERR
jgi:membrane-associated phospholipid phosphatase